MCVLYMENFLGKLKDDSDKYIHWKKLPLKEKLVDNNGTRRLYKIGNGYSRLLKMINFDNNGIPLLNPFEKMKWKYDKEKNKKFITLKLLLKKVKKI